MLRGGPGRGPAPREWPRKGTQRTEDRRVSGTGFVGAKFIAPRRGSPPVVAPRAACAGAPALDRIYKYLYNRGMAKPILWSGTSRRDVKAFPVRARQVAGFQLWRVQQGLEPDDGKPMTSVGSGVKEIRIRTGREHRIVYIAKFADGVYVLHAFEKKTRKTFGRDLEVAKHRLREVLVRRRARGSPGGSTQ